MTNERKEELLASGVKLHEYVADALADRIKAGEWGIGGNLPSESTFCKYYDVSRHTLRHALATLEAQGLILRRQGAPTRVISRDRAVRYVQSVAAPWSVTQRLQSFLAWRSAPSGITSVVHAVNETRTRSSLIAISTFIRDSPVW